MTCDDARQHLLDLQRDRLPTEIERELTLHLEACPACARARAEEEVLTELLERRLPLYPASAALKRRLRDLAATLRPSTTPAHPERSAAERRVAGGRSGRADLDTAPGSAPASRAPAPGPAPVAPRRWPRLLAPALAAAALVVAMSVALQRRADDDAAAIAALTREAVNDHLRVLQRERRVEIESGATHQVKPWFEGKLDFAPVVPSPVEPDMRLEGGSTGYFIDRKAAVVVYGLRSHVVTLLVFRADGLPWPSAKGFADERTPLRGALRGFQVFLWRSGELGYALVGDVDPAGLSGTAAKLAAQTSPPGRTAR